MSQTKESIKILIGNIKYKDWEFHVEERDDCFTLQIKFLDNCTETGEKCIQHCRKWFISKHMTDNEIIRTAFMAVEKAEYHELCEKFTYKGKLINNPHLNLVEVANGIADFENLDHRQ